MRRVIFLVSALLVACQSQVLVPEGHGGAGGGGTVADVVCAGATPVLAADGYDSGFVRCPDGTTTRAHAVTCDTTVAEPACGGDESQFFCHTDTDCTEKPHGTCIHAMIATLGAPAPVCSCVYPCATDADCKDNVACVCRGLAPAAGGWSMCATKNNCTSNEDCPSGECGFSVLAHEDCGEVSVDVVCRSPQDECRTDADCADSGEGKRCVTDGYSSWWCTKDTCHT